MIEITKSLIHAFTDRAKSRFFFAFVISWLFANWKLLYIVVCAPFENDYSPLSLIEKFSPSIHSSFVIPVSGAIFITIVIPYIDAGISWARHFAELWSKTSNEYTRSRIDMMKAKHINNQLSAITDSEDAAKQIQTKEKGGTTRDKNIFARMNSTMNEASIRLALDEFKTREKLNEATFQTLNNLFITTSSIGNSFENQELRSYQLKMNDKLSALITLFRNKFTHNNGSSYWVPVNSAQKDEVVLEISSSFDDFILSYEDLRRKILDIYGE